MTEHLPSITEQDSAAAAVLIEQAVGLSDDESLRETAADLALERGEAEIAESHIEKLSVGAARKLRSARLARLRGDSRTADEMEASALAELPPSERAKRNISSLVRCYDDRLPGPIGASLAGELSKGIEAVDLSALPESDRSAASLALELLRHRLALDTGDVPAAARARSALESALGPNHPHMAILDLRAQLASRTEGRASDEAMASARSLIESCDEIPERIRIIHATLESSGLSLIHI